MAQTNKQLKEEARLIAEDALVSPEDKCVQIAKSLPVEYGTFTIRKMMAVCLLDGFESWTVTKKCALVGVGRTYWYKVTRTVEFADKLCTLQKQTKAMYLPAILKAFVNKAIRGDADRMGNSTNQLAYLRDMEILKGDTAGKQGDLNVNVTIIQQGKEELENNRLVAYERLRYSPSDN